MSNFDSLTKEEKKEVLKILNQISSNGNSTAYNTLLAADYDEIPVDIETFLKEPKYLGRGLIDNEGRFTVFPYWVDTLKKIYPDPLKPAKYNTLALTGCLSGDTKIKCLDGNSYTIKDLFESETFNDKWVYGYDLDRYTIIPDKIIAMKESGVQSIYRVTLDNGEYVDATLNHHFIDRDGQVKSLSEFSVGDSLMPFNHDLTDAGYEQIYIPRADGRTDKICTHTQVSRHTNRYKKNTEVVHHKDFNKRNNNPENLVIWDKSYHIKYHANLSNWDNVNEIHRNPLDKRTIAWKKSIGQSSKRSWDNDPDRHIETSKRVSTMMINGQAAKMSAAVWEGPNSEINRENARQRRVQYNKSYWERNKHLIKDKQFYIDCLSKTYTLGQAIKLSNQPHTRFKYALKHYNIDINDYQRNKTISNHAFANTLNRLSKLSDGELKQSEKAQKFSETYYDSWDEFKEAINLFNHKIVSIEYLKDDMTYDLETQYTHTFGLDCGIFIGNSIGIGKSFVAVLIGLYELYRMICLKDPYVYYGLQPIDKITFAVMNITLDASRGVAWDKMQQLLQSSEWFMDKGTVTGTVNEEWNPPKGIELIAGSLSRHIIGRAVFWSFFDEINFQPHQDVEKQKEKARGLVNTAIARMQSRFMKNDVNPTILVLASSKRTEQSYMETFIESKKKNESNTTLVIDEPQWVIRSDKNTNRKFNVAVGNKFLSSEVIPLDATENDLSIYRDRGYNIIQVPMGYYENFIDDIDVALTDIAGISTSSSSRYISGPRLAEVKHPELHNPFTKEIIEVGNGPEDTTQYSDFFNLENVNKDMMEKPLFVHLDMSISGDKTGIAGVWIKGIKTPEEGKPDNHELVYELAFSVSIKAPKGYQISFEKNRQFIYWLRDNGFNVKGVSCDTFQSYDLLQQLSAHNFNTQIISVDKVTDKICLLGDTLINTPEGKKRIDEILPGDSVYSFNLETQQKEVDAVTTWEHTENVTEYFIISTQDGDIKCTGNHLILTDRGYVEAQNLTEEDLIIKI